MQSPRIAPTLPSRRPLGHAGALRRAPLELLMRSMHEGGDVVRLRVATRHILVVSSPALAQEVLVEKAELFRKSRGLRVFGRPITGQGLLVSENPVHRQRRAVVAPALSANRVAAYADEIVAQTDRLLASLVTRPGCDVAAEMTRLTLNIVASTLFHTRVAADIETVGRAFEEGSLALIALVRAPFLLPDAFPNRHRRTVQRSADALDHIVYRIIRERRASGSDPGDVLSRLLTARDPETGAGLDDTALRDEVMTLFLAGHETTANALTWSLALLGRNPEAARRLADEVDSVLGERAPCFADLPQLPYALAVFKEAMRLYPPAYLITRNNMAALSIGGYHVPADSLVFVNVYGIHRRAETYPDPARFDPSRFLDGAERQWPKAAYMPFGLGPRVCVGNHFAMMEGQLVLARLAQRLVLRDSTSALPPPLPLITLRPGQRIDMRLRVRPAQSSREVAPGALDAE